MDANAAVEALGKYRVIARLGRGGMADVFLALAGGPLGVNKLVVIKRLRDDDDEAFVRMFVDEARLSAQLSHPNIVHTYEAGASSAGYYIAMEYLDGQPLSAVFARARKTPGVLPPMFGAHVVCEALRGLHYAHELCDYEGRPLGIVHRDVSPHNIFLTYAGDVKLVDFGIAKAASNRAVTAAGSIKGKTRYMAPEQARGQTDRRADLFSLGIILWEFSTGERLFKGDDIQALLSLMSESIPRASEVRPGLDPALDAVIARALEQAPERRYQTAEQMRSELMACLPRDQDAGLLMTRKVLDDLFATTREESRRRLQACMANPPPAPPTYGASWPESDALYDLWQRPNESTGSAAGRVDTTNSPAASGPRASSPGGPKRWAQVGALAAFVFAGAVFTSVNLMNRHAGTQAQAAMPPTTSPAERSAKIAVTVEVEPPDAVVTLGGRPLGPSPVRVDVDRSGHTFVVSKEGFLPEELFVDGAREAGDTVSWRVRLRPRPASDDARPSRPAPPVARYVAPSGQKKSTPQAQPTAEPEAALKPAPTAASARKVRAIVDEDTSKVKAIAE
jgi:eukaryotic-like serine/threonine-protein kinase